MCNYLKRTVSDRIKLIKDNDNLNIAKKPILTKRQQNKIDTANRKWKIIKEAQKLYAENNSKSYIARKLGIGRETLNKYLKLTEPPVKDSSCIIDNYMSIIKEVIVDKKKTKEIY